MAPHGLHSSQGTHKRQREATYNASIRLPSVSTFKSTSHLKILKPVPVHKRDSSRHQPPTYRHSNTQHARERAGAFPPCHVTVGGSHLDEGVRVADGAAVVGHQVRDLVLRHLDLLPMRDQDGDVVKMVGAVASLGRLKACILGSLSAPGGKACARGGKTTTNTISRTRWQRSHGALTFGTAVPTKNHEKKQQA